MKIGVDLLSIVPGPSGGIVPHMEGVLDAVFRHHPEHDVVLFHIPENEALCPAAPPRVRRLTVPRDQYYARMDRVAQADGLDAIFATYPRRDRLRFPMARQVVFIPDLQHDYFPGFFTAAALEWRWASHHQALGEAGAIGTNSEHARRTIRAHPRTRCADVFLMGPAADRTAPAAPEDLSAEERALLPGGPFFLYPANVWPHKNHRRVLEAFGRLLETEPGPIEFVFTGHPDGWAELARDFAHLPVRHLGFVRRAFLQALLRRAEALVFFSLFEGFGMPLLEAFQAGTPVLCSNTTSLPEVGGDAVLTADPTDPAAMSGAMACLLREPGLPGRLVAAGKERLQLYSWEASARNLVDACRRVADRAGRDRRVFPAILRLGRIVRERARPLFRPLRARHG